MKNRSFGGKHYFEKDFEKLGSLYKTYALNKVDSHSNVFYAFTQDKFSEIQEFLYATGYKELLYNESGIYIKKSDIFRSVCIDKICSIIGENEDIFILTEQFIFLGKDNFHKPDITLFIGFNEELYDDYLDVNMTNPLPDVVIEVIDVNDIDFLMNLIRVYKRIKVVGDILIFFIDPIKKELYVMRTDVQVSGNDKELLMLLGKIDYYKDIQYKNVNFNFEKILSKQ